MKPILGNTDSLQLFPLSYNWAWEMYLENMDNHWTPREIQVAADVALWRSDSLSDSDRHLFLTVMEQLTTFDVQRGDETAEVLQSIIDPPELKHYLKRLADEEALHTWSYQFIIENFGLDQQEIYSAYSRIQVLRDRVDFANRWSIGAKKVYIKRIINPDYQYDLLDRQVILLALIFWFFCFEGIWFVMGLSGPIQNFARLGKFQGAAEQFQYILRDEFQHILFGGYLIKAYIDQNPDCITPDFLDDIVGMFKETVELEKAFIEYCLPKPILGYSAEAHVGTTKFYANIRAKQLNLPELYPGAMDQLRWRHEMMFSRKEKNFFETRPTEYRTGGALNWED